MFTGIIQGMAQVMAINDTPTLRQVTLRLPEKYTDHLQMGASVAINGVCLTLTAHQQQDLSFDIMQETLDKTNLAALKTGDWVNFERAARFGDEIGGHLMSGHIMTTTTICAITHQNDFCCLTFRLPEALAPYILPKGFIGLNGASLTIGEVTTTTFNVYLIPETLRVTLFGQAKVGDVINIEIDAMTQAVVTTTLRFLTQSKH